ALHPSQLLQPVLECCQPGFRFRIALGEYRQHTDAPHPLTLLRARRKRPRDRAAKRSDQFPSSDSDRHEALPCEGSLVKETVSHRKCAVLTLKDGGPSAKGSPMTQASPLTRFGLVQLPT